MNDDFICWSCGTVESFTDLARDFTGSLADALAAPVNILFGTLLILWIVTAGYKLVLRPEAAAGLVSEFFWIVVASVVLLGSAGGLITLAYDASLDVMGVEAGDAMLVDKYQGMPALMASLELAIQKIFEAAFSIFEIANYNPLVYLYGLLLLIPFMLMFFMYFAKIIVSMFRVMLVAMSSPFLLMAFAFNWGRPMAVAGVRTLVSSVFVLFAATAAVSVTLHAIGPLDLNYTDAELEEFVSIKNADFVMAVVLGILGTALMTEATSIANSITGSLLTNTSSALITAGLTGGAVGLARGAGRYANPLTMGTRLVEGGAAAAGHAGNWATVGRGASGHAARVAALVARYKGEKPS